MSDFDITAMLLEADNFADDNKYIEAAEIYSKITNVDNNCTPAWYGLGISRAKLGDIEPVSYTHLTLPTILLV